MTLIINTSIERVALRTVDREIRKGKPRVAPWSVGRTVLESTVDKLSSRRTVSVSPRGAPAAPARDYRGRDDRQNKQK